MTHIQARFILVVYASSFFPVLAQNHVVADTDASQLQTKLRSVALGDWSYNGFRVVQSTDPKDTPWQPFIQRTDGYAAMFIDRHKDIPNTGKGGAAGGTRHPEFTLWIFRASGPQTVQTMEAGINQHQMMQSSIPSILGANRVYVLVGIGDISEGADQVAALASALNIPLNRGH